MVCTRAAGEQLLDIPESSAGRGRGQATRGNTPPPPPLCPLVSLDQLLATQNELLRMLMENEAYCGADRQQPRQQDMDSLYLFFLVTHPPLFFAATDPLEADNWLHITKSKFGLLHYAEFQKTLYAAQQL
jgi:hypothetical protein